MEIKYNFKVFLTDFPQIVPTSIKKIKITKRLENIRDIFINSPTIEIVFILYDLLSIALAIILQVKHKQFKFEYMEKMKVLTTRWKI